MLSLAYPPGAGATPVSGRARAISQRARPPIVEQYVTVPLNGEKQLTAHSFMFRAGSGRFYSCFALASGALLVYGDIGMSGNATTYAWQGEAGEDLSCTEAAALLGVPPAALERWAQHLAFPTPSGDPGSMTFKRSEIEALRDALVHTHSVEGAVRAARERSGD